MDRPYYLALLAEAYAHAGRIAEGLAAVAEGLAIVQDARGGQPFFYEAELHRLKGILLLQRGGATGAIEADLRRALEVAGLQHNRSLELRAALALTRLSHAADARRVLEVVYGHFS
jgi:hypothetical protein